MPTQQIRGSTQIMEGLGGSGDGSVVRVIFTDYTLADTKSLVVVDYFNLNDNDLILEGDATLMIL